MKKSRRLISLMLALAMTVCMLPATSYAEAPVADGAGVAVEKYIGSARIGNKGYSAENASYIFKQNLSGITYTSNGGDASFNGEGGRVKYNGALKFTIDVSQNDILYSLAKGGTCTIAFHGGTNREEESDDGLIGTGLFSDDDYYWTESQIMIMHGNSRVATTTGRTDTWGSGYKSGVERSNKSVSYSCTLSTTDVFEIYVWSTTSGHGNANDGTTYSLSITFTDTTSPVLSYDCSYSDTSFTTTSTEGRDQLLIKLGDPQEYVNLSASFSKPVTLEEIGSEAVSDMVHHTLFTNTPGTGYIGQGENRGLTLHSVVDPRGTTYESTSYTDYSPLNHYIDVMNLRYSAARGDFSSNVAIPNGGGIETENSYGISLLDQMANASFHDAAGNPLVITTAAGSNIFDIADRGYDVIVDAEPPTYTKTGNGITPDILTGVVVNKNDSFEFVVDFSEYTMPCRGENLDQAKTYLMLNNGDRAYFAGIQNDGKQWIFSYDVTGDCVETALLKVIALTNEAYDDELDPDATGSSVAGHISDYTFAVDARCISDYVGNVMTERANEDQYTNDMQIESSIAWAQLAIDNTIPVINFSYSPYSAMMTVPTELDETEAGDGLAGGWGQGGNIFVDASDARTATTQYDPDQRKVDSPSRGIYRPEGALEGSSPTGLIFYVWSDDPTPPDAGTNFEVIKRFSLAGWDATAIALMDDETSPYSTWKSLYDRDFKLTMANNLSEVVPPTRLFDAENSGTWYLHVWTADMTWDSARQLMQYDLMYGLKFAINTETNAPYTYAEQSALRNQMVEDERESRDCTYLEAQEGIEDAYYSIIYTPDYLARLRSSAAGFTSPDAEMAARNETMRLVGSYGDTTLWPLDAFRHEDSNWVQKTAAIRFDNVEPYGSFNYDDTVGNNTSNVSMSVSLFDDHSGIDGNEVYYQWVSKPEGSGDVRPEETKELSDIDWVRAIGDEIIVDPVTHNAELVVDTKNEVFEDGEYYLSVYFFDTAGNEMTIHSEQSVMVDSSLNVSCDFSQAEDAAEFFRSVTPSLHIAGFKVGEVRYAVSNTKARPDDSAFTVIASIGAQDTEFDKFYSLPAMGAEKEDGTWYVHVLIMEDTADAGAPFYFNGAYKLDNTAPHITVNPDGGAIEKTEYSVTVTANDDLSGLAADGLFYQWTKTAAAPAADDSAWVRISSLDTVKKTIALASESGAYYLHVKALDAAGNSSFLTSDAFLLKIEQKAGLADYASRLISVYQDGSKLRGIAELLLDTDDKAEYRYSITTNGGTTWSTWQPYCSMIKLTLPIPAISELSTLAGGKIAVKFRAPSGEIGEAKDITIDWNNISNEVWATAELESLKERAAGKPLAILMYPAEGVSVEANTEKNAFDAVKDADGDFIVTRNGAYYFTLTKGPKSAELCVVVDLYDENIPVGVVTYSETAPTAANVLAVLETSEPVNVTEIRVLDSTGAVTATKPGSDKYIFEENGRVEFVFADAAGNVNTKIAAVSNIDHTAPDVEIVTMYSDGKGHDYSTFETGSGQLLSNGLFLTLEKTASGNRKDFIVISGCTGDTLEVTKNGT